MPNSKKTIIHTLVIYSLLLLSNTVNSQNAYSISGYLIDSVTNKPIMDANVYIRHIQIGTRSNGDGYFKLIVDSAKHDGTIEISHIGYKYLTFSLSNSYFHGKKYFLSPVPILLPEISISPINPFDMYPPHQPHVSLAVPCR